MEKDYNLREHNSSPPFRKGSSCVCEDKNEFELLMDMAKVMEITETGDNDYYIGYTRGLRKAYHGDIFGTREEHDLWYNIPENDTDIFRRQRGRGYRDGYAGKKPKQDRADA